MAGHQYPRVSGQDSSFIHAGDQHSHVTSSGPIVDISAAAKHICPQLPNEAHDVNGQLDKINVRVAELEQQYLRQVELQPSDTITRGTILGDPTVAVVGEIVSATSLRDGPPVLSVEEKIQAKKGRRHQSHNLVERRRRDKINETVYALEDLLPKSMIRKLQAEKFAQFATLGVPADEMDKTRSLSKGDILQLTLQHLAELTEKDDGNGHIQELQRELENTKSELETSRQNHRQADAELKAGKAAMQDMHARLGTFLTSQADTILPINASISLQN